MPTLRDVKRAGYHRLYSEVQRNGGRKLVAARIGLPLKPGSGEHGKFATLISYGTFEFDFGVALLEYIMNKCVCCSFVRACVRWVMPACMCTRLYASFVPSVGRPVFTHI